MGTVSGARMRENSNFDLKLFQYLHIEVYLIKSKAETIWYINTNKPKIEFSGNFLFIQDKDPLIGENATRT